MEKIHVVTRSGGVLKGQEALNALYDAVGWGWVTTATRAVPALGWIAGRAVDAVSALRLPLSGKTIANLSAIRRAQQEQAGDAECGASLSTMVASRHAHCAVL